MKGEVDESIFNCVRKLTLETSVTVYGLIRHDTRSIKGCEISMTNINVIHQSADVFKISPKEHVVAIPLENYHLWIHYERQIDILKIHATIIKSPRDCFDRQGITNLYTTIFTPSACI
jgi:asparaginyl-tRNA synthetase